MRGKVGCEERLDENFEEEERSVKEMCEGMVCMDEDACEKE